MTNIVLSGGSGLLGRNLRVLCSSITAPNRQFMDITDSNSVKATITKYQPDLFIHSAALVGTAVCEQNPRQCTEVNINGTQNVITACANGNIRLVFISTNYVFDGEKGNYSENDPVSPLSEYARSKAAAESLITGYDNSLVIRTTFCSSESWKFDGAFIDQFSSTDTVEVIALEVLRAAKSDLTGILHIGSERKSQFEMAKRIDPDVKPKTLKEVSLPLARDTSLNCSRWADYKTKQSIDVYDKT